MQKQQVPNPLPFNLASTSLGPGLQKGAAGCATFTATKQSADGPSEVNDSALREAILPRDGRARARRSAEVVRAELTGRARGIRVGP